MSRGLLVMFAGGDPWKVNATLQSGRPAQIADLGQAFHNAGQSTQEADKAFDEARRCVDFWIRDNGLHPITDSTEVQRTATALGLQASRLPKIAVDLENVAAALAQTQGTANGYINALEARLQTLDDWIGQADDMIKQDDNLLAQAEDDDDICGLEDDIDRLEQYINDCEREAVDDTKATLQQLERVRDDYADGLKQAKANLRTDGYDPTAIQALDGEDPKGQAAGDIPPSGFETSELADLRHVTNQAVVDQMAKVRAAQKALDDAAVTAYTKGQGSPEGQAALASLPQLKKNLADALNDLGKLPDYNNIDPAALRASADGHFLFGYTADGQPVQVTGQLKNGTGEIFDQGTGTYYTFKDGKLVSMRTPDPGRAEAIDEPLLSAVTLAVGAPELKAGGEAAVQGFKALLERRAVGLGADITSDNVLAQTFTAAENRAEPAAEQLAAEQAGHVPTSLPAGAAEPPPPVTATDHPAPATTHDPPPAGNGMHFSVPPADAVPHPLPQDSPLFDGYHPVAPGPEFTRADGSLIYPDDTLASKPYAVPGTVVPDAHLPQGTVIDRFGYPGGAYLSPDGVPFAERALPPESALKPYYQYVVNDPTALPPGWHIEESQAAPWFHQPGGGPQYRIIAPPGEDPSVDALVESGYLKVVVKQ
jgi:Tuberculosis necrotizing toxin